MAGGVDDYNMNSYYVFCDLDTLKQIMKKEFNGRVIPGQPSTKSGKAYKEFYYSSAQVKVDDMSNVNDVAKQIREMGYNVETNVEYMEDVYKRQSRKHRTGWNLSDTWQKSYLFRDRSISDMDSLSDCETIWRQLFVRNASGSCICGNVRICNGQD